MSTANKLYPEPNAIKLESMLNDLVNNLNSQRQSIMQRYRINDLDIDIVRYLDTEDTKKMKQIGEHFNIKLSTLTSIIDKLEKYKLVKRKHSREDRRVIYLHPTAKGQGVISELIQVTQGLAEEINANLKNHEFKSFTDVLERMVKASSKRL